MSLEEAPWFTSFAKRMEPLMDEAADRISATRQASTVREEDVHALFQALGIVIIPDPGDPSWEDVLGGPVAPETFWYVLPVTFNVSKSA